MNSMVNTNSPFEGNEEEHIQQLLQPSVFLIQTFMFVFSNLHSFSFKPRDSLSGVSFILRARATNFYYFYLTQRQPLSIFCNSSIFWQ